MGAPTLKVRADWRMGQVITFVPVGQRWVSGTDKIFEFVDEEAAKAFLTKARLSSDDGMTRPHFI